MRIHNRPSSNERALTFFLDPSTTNENEEFAAYIQGYVLRCNLPPITRPEQLVLNEYPDFAVTNVLSYSQIDP
jgi:hypothetical protein